MSIFDGYNLTFVESAALYTVLAHSFTERNDLNKLIGKMKELRYRLDLSMDKVQLV